MSGTDDSMPKLFVPAANLLLGERSEATGDPDAKQMLRALDYAVPEPATRNPFRDREPCAAVDGCIAIRACVRTGRARRTGSGQFRRGI